MDARIIRNAVEMERQVLECGFLPFFRCGIPGFSIEERTAWDCWFPDEGEGAWEWKGPVIREGHCAYGKIFNRKAGYVSLEWLPDLMNYRRSLRYAKDEDTAALDDMVLQTVACDGGATAGDLRRMLGLSGRRGGRRAEGMREPAREEIRISLEPVLARLMMGLRIVISDFEYRTDRHGRPYGWGVARYALPETLYGRLDAGCTPEESFRKMRGHLRRLCPDAPERRLLALIG